MYPTTHASAKMPTVNGSKSVDMPSDVAASYQTLSLFQISGSASASASASVCDSARHMTSAAPTAMPIGYRTIACMGALASASPAIADQNSSMVSPGVGTQLPSDTDMLSISSAPSRISRLLQP